MHLKQDIVGLKVRVAGDAVLDSDTWMPQVAVGLQHKRTDAGDLGPTLFGPLGAKRSGTDVYASATKLFLGQGLLVNATLRLTKANQGGLLGFGGAQANSHKLQPEFSVAKLLSKNVVVGADQELFTDRRVRGPRSHRPGCAATPANRRLPLRPVRVLTNLAQTFDLSPSRNTS